ncbi:MAG TPA: VWA domain-containing protein [Terriglobales bacterium]
MKQRAAIHFLEHVLTSSNDLAFVVGVANSVLVVQDFSSDQQQLAHAVNQLAPGGGTAVWDAVSYAAKKLASREETGPVAKLLVVMSDGKDNSSTSTLKEAIESADAGDVFVYTLCTAEVGDQRDPLVEAHPNLLGPRAMKLLAEATGGASLTPHTFRGLDSTLGSIQELIRSRYLISYKPADFTPDGSYRRIEISASRSGHKLRVYARRGYYTRKQLTARNN